MVTGSKIADFDDDLVRLVADLAGRAAHDSGHRERPGRIRDHQRLGVQGPDDVIQRLQPLAGRARVGR